MSGDIFGSTPVCMYIIPWGLTSGLCVEDSCASMGTIVYDVGVDGTEGGEPGPGCAVAGTIV